MRRTLLANAVTGVSDGFSKSLEVNGVGYRVNLKGKDLELSVGYSHPVLMKLPDAESFHTVPNLFVKASKDFLPADDALGKVANLLEVM